METERREILTVMNPPINPRNPQLRLRSLQNTLGNRLPPNCCTDPRLSIRHEIGERDLGCEEPEGTEGEGGGLEGQGAGAQGWWGGCRMGRGAGGAREEGEEEVDEGEESDEGADCCKDYAGIKHVCE